MAAFSCANRVVVGGGLVASSVARHGVDNALSVLEHALYTPKTAARKNRCGVASRVDRQTGGCFQRRGWQPDRFFFSRNGAHAATQKNRGRQRNDAGGEKYFLEHGYAALKFIETPFMQ